jgi:hypothetical protein
MSPHEVYITSYYYVCQGIMDCGVVVKKEKIRATALVYFPSGPKVSIITAGTTILSRRQRKERNSFNGYEK